MYLLYPVYNINGGKHMNLLEKLHKSIEKLSGEATELAILKDQFGRDIVDIDNKITDIDTRLSQIVGAIKEIDSVIREAEEPVKSDDVDTNTY